MDNRHIIETIVAVYATVLKENKRPQEIEEFKNKQRFVWMLDDNVKLTVDQIEDPADNHYLIESDDFEITLKEDSQNQKYILDAPKIDNEEHLGQWLGSMWLKCKDNLQQQ